ncbi:MAG: tail fiber domain-containing protein [Okeania sp. SIO3H1]|nr:tail fiber domain-containing protein [Okeania sp. SIO3H1]
MTEWNDLSSAVAGNSGLTLAINPEDKIGIGTKAPAAKLEVHGDLKVSDNAEVANVFLGDVDHGELWAGFGHKDAISKTGYGLLQNKDGTLTLINKKSGSGYIGFRVENVDKMVLLDSGNLGIGTTSPSTKLEVSGDVTATKFIGDGSKLTNVGATGLNLATTSGSVGIGTTNPQEKLDVNGNARINGLLKVNSLLYITDNSGLLFHEKDYKRYWMIIPNWKNPNDADLQFFYEDTGPKQIAGSLKPRRGWISPSDQRIKKDIEPLSNVLEEVMKLQPRSYRWFDSQDNSRKFLGFIAQEVEQVFPDCVSKNDDLKGLNYNDFAVMAIAAIKEVKLEYDKRIAALEQELADLKKKPDTGV